MALICAEPLPASSQCSKGMSGGGGGALAGSGGDSDGGEDVRHATPSATAPAAPDTSLASCRKPEADSSARERTAPPAPFSRPSPPLKSRPPPKPAPPNAFPPKPPTPKR
eukprot:scaffold222526_cov28-Tisochrysis_lutea.AAC.1